MARQTKGTLKAPCIGVCFLDLRGAACVGCFRTPAEISEWAEMSETQQLKILERLGDKF